MSKVSAIAIGRNEGARLIRCLESLQGQVHPIVYVDSGSTDDSIASARALGASVVELDATFPFTAARARTAGLRRLSEIAPDARFVQVIDGDCELRPCWIEAARTFLDEHPDIAVVCGRRRERHPETTIWSRLMDAEWDTPLGAAVACGGDALMRLCSLAEVGGYRDELIAGEEPEMCLRLRRAGWRIWRLDAEMTWHDAAITQFSQWWRRMRRGGYAFAEVSTLHRSDPESFWVPETRRALAWGAGVPLAALAGAIVTPWALLLCLAWPAQVVRLCERGMPFENAIFTVLGKLPEAQGVLDFYLSWLSGRHRTSIEYK